MSNSIEGVKVPQYFEVLRHFFTNQDENYNLLHFYNLNTQFIISNTYQWDVKSTWKKRFFDAAKLLNKDIIKDAPEPDWEELKRLVFEAMSKKSELTASVAPMKRKTSGSETSSILTTKKESSSGSSANVVKALTPSSYQALSITFNKFFDSKKWKLEDGVYVEDTLYNYAKIKKT